MAASLGLRPAAFLRALGLRERCLYRYSERNPLLLELRRSRRYWGTAAAGVWTG